MKHKTLIATIISVTLCGCSSLETWEPELDPSTQPAVELVASHAFLNVCAVSASLKMSPRNVMNATRIMKSDEHIFGLDFEEYDEDTTIILNQRLNRYKSDGKKFTTPEDLPARSIEIVANGGTATIESGFNTHYWCAIDMQGGNPNKVISILLGYFENADEPFTIIQQNQDNTRIIGLLDNRNSKVEDIYITMTADNKNGKNSLLVTALPYSLLKN